MLLSWNAHHVLRTRQWDFGVKSKVGLSFTLNQ